MDESDYSGDGSTDSTTPDTVDAISQLSGSAALLIAAVRGNTSPPPPQQVTPSQQSAGPVISGKGSFTASPILILIGLAVLVILVKR